MTCYVCDARTVQLELTNISKRIAGLLTQPLASVVVQLRELKSSQSTKKKQLESLEARERSVLKKITHGDDGEEEEERNGGSGYDVSFGLPVSMEGGKVTEEQLLIQTGQLTPFGGQVHDNNAESASSVIDPLATNHISSSPSTSVSKATPPSIQLSHDSFDGLFSDIVFVKPTKKMVSERSKGKEKQIDKEAASSLRVQEGGASSSQEGGASSSQEGISTSSQSCEAVSAVDNDEWMPNEAELAEFESEMLSSSEDSEYLTDDELGTPKKKKRKKLRELSSEEEEELEGHVTSKQRSRKRKRKSNHYLDDGDDEMYRLRIW